MQPRVANVDPDIAEVAHDLARTSVCVEQRERERNGKDGEQNGSARLHGRGGEGLPLGRVIPLVGYERPVRRARRGRGGTERIANEREQRGDDCLRAVR